MACRWWRGACSRAVLQPHFSLTITVSIAGVVFRAQGVPGGVARGRARGGAGRAAGLLLGAAGHGAGDHREEHQARHRHRNRGEASRRERGDVRAPACSPAVRQLSQLAVCFICMRGSKLQGYAPSLEQ